MEYNSTYIRYERKGARVVPVRVTKSWVTAEGLRGKLKTKAFVATRVTEVRMRDVRGDREQAPEAWDSSPNRVESRARLLGLKVKYSLEEGGLPVLVDPTAGPCLAMDCGPLTAAQARQPMEAEPESREWYLRREWAESRGFDDDVAEAA